MGPRRNSAPAGIKVTAYVVNHVEQSFSTVDTGTVLMSHGEEQECNKERKKERKMTV